VPQSAETAIELLAEATGLGSIEAAWALYHQYQEGEYVQADPERASHWLVRAAELGSVAAACALADTLEGANSFGPPASRVFELLEYGFHRPILVEAATLLRGCLR